MSGSMEGRGKVNTDEKAIREGRKRKWSECIIYMHDLSKNKLNYFFIGRYKEVAVEYISFDAEET